MTKGQIKTEIELIINNIILYIRNHQNAECNFANSRLERCALVWLSVNFSRQTRVWTIMDLQIMYVSKGHSNNIYILVCVPPPRRNLMKLDAKASGIGFNPFH
jgi:hypothetical protein